jgi:N-acetyl-anhydromuramyl-L-alanine amidase AmpD
MRRISGILTGLAALLVPLSCGVAPPVVPADAHAGAECPPDVVCDFVPAAYQQTEAGDPSAYGNYDRADRPRDGNDIRYIVIHDTEESYDAAMRAFRTATRGVSAHYLVDSPDGRITQVVPTEDIAFHAGNYWFNTHSIGIEHVGVLAEGRRWYTEAVYQASAQLVRYLAERYHIPLDREHILGHEDIPGSTATSASGMHYDPGPYWDWDHYFALLGAPLPDARWSQRFHPELAFRRGAVSEQLPSYRPWPEGGYAPRIVTISPRFAANTGAILTRCAGDRCVDQPRQPSNVVYLHTAPAADSPLLSDPLLHPDGEPGGTGLDDWSAKASIGQSFVVAGRASGWTAIWFGGQRGWFADLDAEPRSVPKPAGTLLTPRPGCSTIPVYGAANPEPSAYPASIQPITITRLPYVISAGQVYLGVEMVHASSYHTRFDPPDRPSVPANHTLVTGRRVMWEISFNHRRAFVDAADVQPFTPQTSSPPPGTTPPPCANPEPPPRVVTVRRGDNLDALARSHHVTGGWWALYQANRSQVSSPRLIHPGQQLVLP